MTVRSLRLTPFSSHGFAVLASWFENQAQLTQWGGPDVRYPLDDSQMEAMLPRAPARHAWMAMRGGTSVGHAQLTVDGGAGVARMRRIVIAPDDRGQRLATPMLQLVLDRAFATLGIDRVELGVYTWNAGAIRTYTRLGFLPGEVRRASVRIEDEAWDLQEMSVARAAFIAAAANCHPPGAAPRSR